MTSRSGSENEADPNGTTPSDQSTNAGGPAVERIVERFGGIRPMAHKLDIPVTTVQGWKKRGAIPLARHADLRAAAAKYRVKLSEADLEAATPSEERTAAPLAPTPIIAPDAAPDAAASVTPLPADPAIVTPPEGVEPAKPADTDTPAKDAAEKDSLAKVYPAAPGTDEPAATPAADKPFPEAPEPVAAEAPQVEPVPAEATDAASPEKVSLDKVSADKAESTDKPEPAVAEPVGAAASPVVPEYRRPEHQPPEPPRSPEYPREERRSGGAGFATFVSLVALLVGAAALSEPWWGPRVPGWPARGAAPQAAAPVPAPAPAPAQPDPVLRAQLQQLADRLGQLEQRPAPTPAPAAAPAPAGNSQALEGALRQLASRIDGLEQRVQQAVAAPAPAAAPAEPDPRVGELTDRLGGIEQRLAAVGSDAQADAQAAQALRQELEGLKQQLSSVSQAVETRRDAATAAQALVLAAGQLRAALALGQPFQQELQAVRALGAGDAQVTQPLDAVAAYAGKGVPTQPTLTDRFQALESEIVKAENRGNSPDWVDQVTGKLATLVTVRRQGGGVVGDGAAAVTARADAALQEGDLAKAVQEVSALKGPAAETAAPWLADAKARLAANQAAQQLSARAIGLLSAAGGAKTGGTGQ